LESGAYSGKLAKAVYYFTYTTVGTLEKPEFMKIRKLIVGTDGAYYVNYHVIGT